ncbi:MAG TPA: FdtA/QdtA family cupin domain-containing protein [Candidatus Paceibacterota bacterium]|nr:FdtA/QdtA family cupin domain-containing protein [Candidatus Paceibacterota bacterium]
MTKNSTNGRSLGSLLTFKTSLDDRGDLTVIEFLADLPFMPKRFYSVYNVPATSVRGDHAHRTCQQVLVALAGSVLVTLKDGLHEEEYLLDSPRQGLHIPALVWGIQHGNTSNAVLGVFASEPYDANEYIRDYEELLGLRGHQLSAGGRS